MPEVAFEIVIILLLIILNGVFAMSELAIASSRRVRLQQMAEDGSRGAAVALELAQDPNRFLSTVQVGITLVGILTGAFGGATLAGALGEPLSQVPVIGPYASAISFVLVVGVITFLSVVIGELVPKRIALQNTEQIAAAVARPMRTLSAVIWPIARLLGLATDAILSLFRIEAPAEAAVTEEEIRMLVEQSAQAGIIEEVERDMVESVFRLGDRPLDTMMTPRPEIVWLDVNAPEEEIRQIVRDSNHSRFPVCDGQLDKALGVVRAKDILSRCLSNEPLDLRAVMQEPLFAPENAQALKALERFKQSGVHLALLVDEYGGIEGLVTLIDILEAIVGDIPTMDEMVEPPIIVREDGSWLVDGLISIEDFKQAFDIRVLPGEGEYQTLGGFVVFMLGSLPMSGNHFGYGGFRFEVADMDGKRVDKVIVEAAPPEDEQGEGGEADSPIA